MFFFVSTANTSSLVASGAEGPMSTVFYPTSQITNIAGNPTGSIESPAFTWSTKQDIKEDIAMILAPKKMVYLSTIHIYFPPFPLYLYLFLNYSLYLFHLYLFAYYFRLLFNIYNENPFFIFSFVKISL